MTAPDLHRPTRPAALCSLVVLASLLAVAVAADDPKPAPATAPTSAPTPAPAASPKAVVAALAATIDKGDAKAAAALLVADEAHAKWAQSTVALAGALKQLDAAAVARFGPGVGDAVSQHRLHLTDAFKAAEQSQEKVDGDAATVTSPGQTSPLTLTKGLAGRWLLRVAPATEPAQHRQRELYDRLTTAATRTAAEIAAKTYDTPETAARAFAARVTEARLGT